MGIKEGKARGNQEHQFSFPTSGAIFQRELLIRPRARRFDIEESIETDVVPIVPNGEFNAAFRILEKKGEGYAGQVYKTVDEATGKTYALKALRPEDEGKEKIRNFFFRLCFAGNFAPATNEAALRYGLLCQTVLRRGAQARFGDTSIIPEPYGYFWNDKLETFVELHEWVEGHIPVPDSTTHNRLKRDFMDSMVGLANDMGAYQLARQYKWWTMLAGANVVEREDGSQVAIDWRSGVALPFFLPMSPGDVPIILDNLRHGHFANYDHADFGKLDAFVQENNDAFADLTSQVDELKELDGKYRASIRETTLADWQREFQMDEDVVRELSRSPLPYRGHLILDGIIPLVGKVTHRLSSSEMYRTHAKQILSDGEYRDVWFSTHQTHDLDTWQHRHRLTPDKAQELSQKAWLYLLHKVFFSHMPSSIQKATDNTELKRMLKKLGTPIRIAFSESEQIQWLEDKINEGVELRLLSDEQAQMLHRQSRERKMRSYVIELAAVTPAIEFMTLPAYPLVYFLSGGDMILTGAVVTSPISPSGVVRTAYTGVRTLADIPEAIKERSLKPIKSRASGLAVAPWTKVGMLFVPAQMVTHYPEMARFLTSYFTIKAARNVPVYGVEGGAVEYYAHRLGQKIVNGKKNQDATEF